MPELPEVQTTVNGLNAVLPKLKITDVWSDYFVATTHGHKPQIKNKKYFESFRKTIVGAKVINAERRGKNILINLSNAKTILVHMKMTGHFLYGNYVFNSKLKKDPWTPKSNSSEWLRDPFNRFIHLVFSLSNGKQLVFSDVRKFGKVIIFDTNQKHLHPDIVLLGPDPFDKKLTVAEFKKRLLVRPNAKIKQALLDQTIIAGIGNIYSDEILWASGVHPERLVKNISDKELKIILDQKRIILAKSIKMGGDSLSDYRNIYGERGGFQNCHKAYRQTGKHCSKKGCKGVILRKVIAGRSSHFCSVHQK